MKKIDLEGIISDLFGLSKDAPELTPMDKGECLKAMYEACNQTIDLYSDSVSGRFNNSEIDELKNKTKSQII